MLNPFGEDNDDIDANYIIDRNFQMGYFMVSTEDSAEDPEEDIYGDSIPPPTLPHTVSSYKHKEPAPVCLTDNVHLSEESMMLNNPDHPAFSKLRVSLSPNLNRNHTSIDLLQSRLQSSAKKNGGLSGGSRVRRPGSEDPHRRERKFFAFFGPSGHCAGG